MFCTQCGNKIPDNSKFCGVCGAKQNQEPAVESNWVSAPEVSNPGEGSRVSAPEWKDPVDVVEEKETATKADKPAFLKKLDLKKILIAAGALVVVIAIILGGIAMFANKGSENVFVCYSDGKYKLVTNLKKAETLNIASAKSDDVNYQSVRFSPDDKYIYFFTKGDYSGHGSLCRAEYAKLKEDSKKNDKYIETIASNVEINSVKFTEKGEVLYRNGDDTLYHYNGKEVNQLAKRVATFRVDKDDRLVYSVRDDEGSPSLYAMTLKNPEERTKLVTNYNEIRLTDDLDNILFTKANDDGTQDLYKVNFEAEEEKLGDDAQFLNGNNDKIYLTLGTGAKLNLYQFVNDPNAAAEASMTEPVEDQFYIPKYKYSMITKKNAVEGDYADLYTSCTKDLYWYGESTYWCYSMEDALNRNWGEKTVQIHDATRKFIEKFGATADENGYIKVTPEVKTALQEINAANGGGDWQWLWLCFNKAQDGTTLDYDAWDAAWVQWYEARDRIELRERLKSEENDIAIKNLCVFEEGKLSVLINDVVNMSHETGGIMFNTVDMLDETVNIEEVYGIYDVIDLLQVHMPDQNHFLATGSGTVGKLNDQVIEEFENINEEDNAYLRFAEDMLFLCSYDGYLAVSTLKDGEPGEFEMISDDAGAFAVNEDKVLYAAGVYYSDGTAYCDIYEYSDGENTLLAREVLYDAVRLYEDGKLVVYTDYRYSSGYEMGLVDKKGEMTLLADGVGSITRADNNLMFYISDGDLYMYDGKDKKMVCSDVDMFWAKEQLTAEASIYGS